MIRWSVWLLASGLIWATSCGDEGDDSKEPNDSETENDGWLERTATPESEFAPENFEAVLDNIADRLNEDEQQEGMQLAFIPKTLEGFFELAILGANRAHAELGALGTIVAPNLPETEEDPSQTEQQIDIFEEQIGSGDAAGVGLAPMGSELSEVIDQAADDGVPTITFDGDVADSKRALYLGTNNTAAGTTGGETMVAQLGDTTGTVILLGTEDESWEDGMNRTQAALSVLEEADYNVVVVSTDWGDRPANVTEMQEIYETADPPVVGCLGLFSTAFLCVDAAVEAGVENDITVVAFDAEPETLEYMAQGLIAATHVQRSYYMGYLLPYLLYAINTIGIEETKELVSDLMIDDERIDTGLDVIPADGVNAYNTFIDELRAL